MLCLLTAEYTISLTTKMMLIMKTTITFFHTMFFYSVILLAAFACTKEAPAEPAGSGLDAYVGTFFVEEECDGYVDRYSIQIEKNNSGQGLRIHNLYDAGETVYASLRDGQLKIGSAYLGLDGYCKLYIDEGFGEVRGNRLIMNLQLEWRKDPSNFTNWSQCEPDAGSCTLIGLR